MTASDVVTVSRVDPASFAWESTQGPAHDIRRVLESATAADGRSALNEAALLTLRHSGLSAAALWTASLAGRVVGFALGKGAEETVEVDLVVQPSSRRHGAGRALADTVVEEHASAPLSAWSHGNHPAAAVLASHLGFERVRDLWVMRRSMAEDLPPVEARDDLVVRTFDPDRDIEPFLALNAAAFAHHPEQGDLTRADLEQRMAEPWFDPAGFFVAERTTSPRDLVGFHWTKVHDESPAYGEVYVVGVSPDAQGLGLGRLLTLTGLHHLRKLGLSEVILYVEADNAAAVAVYERLGFTHAAEDTDVMYVRGGAAKQGT